MEGLCSASKEVFAFETTGLRIRRFIVVGGCDENVMKAIFEAYRIICGTKSLFWKDDLRNVSARKFSFLLAKITKILSAKYRNQ